MSKKLVHNGWFMKINGAQCKFVLEGTIFDDRIPKPIEKGTFYVLSENTVSRLGVGIVKDGSVSKDFLLKWHIATMEDGKLTRHPEWSDRYDGPKNAVSVPNSDAHRYSLAMIVFKILLIAMALYAIVHLLYR